MRWLRPRTKGGKGTVTRAGPEMIGIAERTTVIISIMIMIMIMTMITTVRTRPVTVAGR